MTITERVLSYLKEQPGTPNEIAEALGLKRRGYYGRGYHPGGSYNWGRWSFSRAEDEGLIEWIDGKWHLKEASG